MTQYTMNDWRRDHTFSPEVNQEIAPEIIEEMRDCVPPQTMSRDLLQVGEAYDHDRTTGQALYATFERVDGKWYFRGHQPSRRTGWSWNQ